MASSNEDQVLQISEDIVPTRTVIASSITTHSFSGLLDPPLKLQTDQRQCGGQLWPAGMVLAEYMLREQLQQLRGKTVVELGAGSGLVGLAIVTALRQQSQHADGKPSCTNIHITDGLPILVPLLEHNIELNSNSSSSSSLLSSGPVQAPQPTVTARAHHFLWGSPPPAPICHPDIILAADCAYLEETFPLLVSSLRDLMGVETVLWFCYKRRRKRDKDCLKLIGKVCEVKVVKGEWERESVFLYEVRRRKQRTRGVGAEAVEDGREQGDGD